MSDLATKAQFSSGREEFRAEIRALRKALERVEREITVRVAIIMVFTVAMSAIFIL